MQHAKEYRSSISQNTGARTLKYKGVEIEVSDTQYITIRSQEERGNELISTAADTWDFRLRRLHSNRSPMNGDYDEMKCWFRISLNGRHEIAPITGKARLIEDRRLNREEYFFFAIRFVENALDIQFPDDMIREICDSLPACKFTPIFRQDVEKLINEGKCMEALEAAKKTQDNSLCFEMGELLLKKNEYHMAQQFFQAIPQNTRYFYRAAQEKIKGIDIIQNPECSISQAKSEKIASNQAPQQNGAAQLPANIASIPSLPTTTIASFNANLNSTVSNLNDALLQQHGEIKSHEKLIVALQAQINALQFQIVQMRPGGNNVAQGTGGCYGYR